MRVLVLVVALIATCPCFSQMHGAGGQSTQQMGTEHGPQNAVSSGPGADKSFVVKALQGSFAVVQAAQQGEQKSSSEQVKQFSHQAIEDHNKMIDELRQAAEQLKVTAPTEPSKAQMKGIEKLQQLSGPEFDQAFVKEMTKLHKDQEKDFKDEAKNTTSPQLKTMATDDAQMINDHLTKIQQLAKP